MIRPFLALLFVCNMANGQTCTHTRLSKQYDFRVTRTINTETDASTITLTIIDKQTQKRVQKISYTQESGSLYSKGFSNCGDVRSYITGINKNKRIEDAHYGDLVIADLNFDGLEDIAIVRESMGTNGPYYNFYIQSKEGKFMLDKYLTAKVGFFPRTIDVSTRKLTTLIRYSSTSLRENTYKLDSATNKWKMISSEIEELE